MTSKLRLKIIQEIMYSAFAWSFLLDAAMLLGSESQPGVSLHRFIVNRIKAFRLFHLDPNDIFMEAIVCGLAYITNHSEPIRNPAAWLRVTVMNLLKAESRKVRSQFQLSDELLERIDFSNETMQGSLHEYGAVAVQAFRNLSKPERRIIVHKLLRGKTYKEINKLNAYLNCSEAAIRQQYSRAIKSLRVNFQQLRQQ